MSLTIRERQTDGITILDLEGRLTAGESTAALRSLMASRMDEGATNFILNMSGVEYIDSSGLGMMVVCYTKLQKAGGSLKLLNLTSRNLELLVLTKLTTVFEVFTDERDAVNSFFPNRKAAKFDVLRFVEQMREKEGEERP